MAMYNNGFPMNYNYYQQPQFQQPYPQQMIQPQQQIQPQIQQTQQQMNQQYPAPMQGGFVRVRNENEARMYPVAPGGSITFIDENAPYCYCKTVNMGQLDRPVFEKYRLVKEDDNMSQPMTTAVEKQPEIVPMPDMSIYMTKDDMAAFRADLDAIRSDMETFRSDLYGIAGKKKTSINKKENVDNE